MTSAKSVESPLDLATRVTSRARVSAPSRNSRTRSLSVEGAERLSALTRAASATLGAGSTSVATPARRACRAIESAPRIVRSAPSRPSSPTNIRSAAATDDSSCPVATRMPMAIGRSNAVPSFFTSAGARFTVIRRGGTLKPELTSAAPTRSRLSFTALAASPTIVHWGSPCAASTSTMTSYASMPTSAAERTAASITQVTCCTPAVRKRLPSAAITAAPRMAGSMQLENLCVRGYPASTQNEMSRNARSIRIPRRVRIRAARTRSLECLV